MKNWWFYVLVSFTVVYSTVSAQSKNLIDISESENLTARDFPEIGGLGSLETDKSKIFGIF